MPTCTLDWYKLLDNQIGIIVNSPPLGNQLCRLALSQLTRWGFYFLLKGSAKMIGEKKACSKCGETKATKEFNKNKSRKGGLNSWCKLCCKEYNRTEKGRANQRRWAQSPDGKKSLSKSATKSKEQGYFKRYRQTPKNKAYEKNRRQNPERKANRPVYKAVNRAVEHGDLPHISTQLCTDCGNKAEHYHHESYDKKDWLNVIPLCALCHKQRHQ